MSTHFSIIAFAANVAWFTFAADVLFAQQEAIQKINCKGGESISDSVALDTVNGYFIYVSSVSKRNTRFASAGYVVETYLLPESCYKILKKQHARRSGNILRANERIEKLLREFTPERKVVHVKYEEKLRQFYPRGLRSGDCISLAEFKNWDFIESEKTVTLSCAIPAINDTAQLNVYFDSIRELDKTLHSNLSERPKPTEVSYHLTKPDFASPYRNTVISDFDAALPELMKNLKNYSPLLGAQRIRLELFDNPVLAAYYTEIYTHYVDSITRILKDSLLIKPGESERFIQAASSIIPERFPYKVNYLLWEGMSKNALDCDNTAYLVFDVGRKLGMNMSLVLLRLHAIVLVGDFVYETTGSMYYNKTDLDKHYPTVFLISSDYDSINTMVAMYEISNFLQENGEIQKAKAFVTEALKVFPDDPQLEQTMGDVLNCEGDYEKAFEYYTKASRKLPDNWLLLFRTISAQNRLLSMGKNEIVLSIINKYGEGGISQ